MAWSPSKVVDDTPQTETALAVIGDEEDEATQTTGKHKTSLLVYCDHNFVRLQIRWVLLMQCSLRSGTAALWLTHARMIRTASYPSKSF